MKQTMILIFTVFFICIYTQDALGGDMGARAAGMGGAYTAVADDAYAPYWNPAGITQIPKMKIGMSSSRGGFSSYFLKLNGLHSFNPNEADTFIIGFITPYMGLNYITEDNISGTVLSGAWQGRTACLDYYTVTAAGYFDHKTALGINYKVLNVKYVISEVSAGSEDYTGEGYSFDVGYLYKINDNWRLGFMARNHAGRLDWRSNLHGESPSSLPFPLFNTIDQSYTAGLAYRPTRDLLLAADLETVDAMDNRYDEVRLHMGVERILAGDLCVRAGAYTRKGRSAGLTAGVGLGTSGMVLDIAVKKADATTVYMSLSINL